MDGESMDGDTNEASGLFESEGNCSENRPFHEAGTYLRARPLLRDRRLHATACLAQTGE